MSCRIVDGRLALSECLNIIPEKSTRTMHSSRQSHQYVNWKRLTIDSTNWKPVFIKTGHSGGVKFQDLAFVNELGDVFELPLAN